MHPELKRMLVFTAFALLLSLFFSSLMLNYGLKSCLEKAIPLQKCEVYHEVY